MLRNFVRGFDNALSKEMCQSLIEWFESKPDVKTKEVNRETRNDKQMWLSETSKLYEPVQKVKLDMLQEYANTVCVGGNITFNPRTNPSIPNCQTYIFLEIIYMFNKL